MQALIVFVISLSSASALGAACLVSRFQYSRTHVALLFPLRATAIVSSVVVLRGWLEMLPVAQACFAWISTVALPVAMLLWPARTGAFDAPQIS
jgi:hypothetical protein